MGIRRIAGALVVALMAGACSLDVPDDVNSISVTLGSDKGIVHDNDSVTITVTARNLGVAPLTLSGPADCLLYIEVRNPTDNLVVWRSNSSCSGANVTEQLVVGIDRMQSFVWKGTNLAGADLPGNTYVMNGVARLTPTPYAGPAVSILVE